MPTLQRINKARNTRNESIDDPHRSADGTNGGANPDLSDPARHLNLRPVWNRNPFFTTGLRLKPHKPLGRLKHCLIAGRSPKPDSPSKLGHYHQMKKLGWMSAHLMRSRGFPILGHCPRSANLPPPGLNSSGRNSPGSTCSIKEISVWLSRFSSRKAPVEPPKDFLSERS